MASAAPPPPNPADAGQVAVFSTAEKVLELTAARDAKGLAELAALDKPDRWLVADALVERQAKSAAIAFVKAARGKDPSVASLLTYLEKDGTRFESELRRLAWDEAERWAGEGDLGPALERLDRAHGGFDDILSARASFARGLLLRATASPERAIRAFRRAAATSAALGWVRQRSRSLHEAGMTAFRRAEHARAAELWEERLELEANNEDVADRLATLENLGLALANVGNYAGAIERHAAALDLARSVGQDAAIARSLVNIGVLHDRRGDRPRAREHYRQGLHHLEAVRAQIEPERALGFETVACEQWGDFTEAVARCQRSLEWTLRLRGERQARPATHDGFPLTAEDVAAQSERERAETERRRALAVDPQFRRASLDLDIGKLLRRLEQPEEALERYTMAQSAFAAIGDRSGEAQAVLATGQIHRDDERYDEAVDAYRRALAIQNSIDDRLGVAWTYIHMGDALFAAGRAEEAVPAYEAGIRRLREMEYRTSIVLSQARLARAQFAVGRTSEAFDSATAALRDSREIGDIGTKLLALDILARIHLTRGEAAEALELVQRALEDLRQIAHGLSASHGVSTREYHAGIFETAAGAAFVLKDPATWLWVLEMGRAGTLLEALGSRGHLRATLVPESLQSAEEAARAGEASIYRKYLTTLRMGQRSEIRKVMRELDAARARLQTAVDRIHTHSQSTATLIYTEPVDFPRIQRALEPNDALVLYGVFEQDAMALVVTRKSVQLRPLGKSENVRSAVMAFDASVVEREDDPPLERMQQLLADALALDRSIRRVLVSPAGVLNVAPWPALFPQREVACVPSASTWLLLREDREQRGERILALGDPLYEDEDGGVYGSGYRSESGQRLAPLPATRAEVEAIGDVVLVGEEATEQQVREMLDRPTRWRAVHLACHGLLDSRSPWQSALALAPDLRNDGRLTVLDLLRMEVQADIAVLSACETGRGALYNAEGMLGLSRAFMHAGAPRVLASLWKVDDEATQALMIKFYELWNGDDGPALGSAEALRQAQRHVAAQPKWSHPYYWAAWILWGLPD